MRILIDTNIYSDAIRGISWAVEILQKADEILISPIVAGEIIMGIRLSSREKQNRILFEQFISSTRVSEISLTRETSERFANIFVNLKKIGKPIPTNDIWIAASAFEHGAIMVSRDRHFKFIDGLFVISEKN